jgi:PrcB C-terminal/S-layer homology domain
MKPKLNFMVILSLVFVMLFTTSVYAFEDIKGDPAEQSIMKLKEDGIVSGETAKQFNPKGKVSFAQGIPLIVKSLDLNINHIKFIRAPLASDYFTSVPDRAWYAEYFIIAHLNGLPVDKDVDPNQTMTREQFAYMLLKAITMKVEFPPIRAMVEIDIEDTDWENEQYKYSVQELAFLKIVQLDKKQMFYPKQEVTRAQAAIWLNAARELVKGYEQKPLPIDPPVIDQDITMKIEKVTNDVNKVTITWGERPNSGYGITIKSIEFKNKEAVISYELHYPEPNMDYLTVISYPKATTYISSQYTPILKPYK